MKDSNCRESHPHGDDHACTPLPLPSTCRFHTQEAGGETTYIRERLIPIPITSMTTKVLPFICDITVSTDLSQREQPTTTESGMPAQCNRGGEPATYVHILLVCIHPAVGCSLLRLLVQVPVLSFSDVWDFRKVLYAHVRVRRERQLFCYFRTTRSLVALKVRDGLRSKKTSSCWLEKGVYGLFTKLPMDHACAGSNKVPAKRIFQQGRPGRRPKQDEIQKK